MRKHVPSELQELTEAQRKQLTRLGYCGMFACRDTPQEAMDYLMDIADACGGGNKPAVLTAGGVLVNSLLLSLMKSGLLVVPEETEESKEDE
jgi:hypothetical protein